MVVIGCGGGGGGNNLTTGTNTTGTNTNGNTTGRADFGVQIPNRPGLLDVYLLPGQGRANGSVTADIGNIVFIDSNGYDTTLENALTSDIFLQLDGFNAQNRHVNASVPSIESGAPQVQSRIFTDMSLEIRGVQVIDDQGGSKTYNGDTEDFGKILNITAFQGRTSAVQLLLNDGMINYNNNNSITLDRAAFIAANQNPATKKIQGFLSDYLMFDISHLPDSAKPMLASPDVAGTVAQKVYVSGDNYSLSQGGSSGVFETLYPSETVEGSFFPLDPVVNLRTYRLQTFDPRYIFPPRLITALAGTYYPYQERLVPQGSLLFATFPGTGDGSLQQLIIIQGSGGNITNMYFGNVNFASKPNPTFSAYPIKDIQPASTAGQLKGILPAGSLVDKNHSAVSTSAANYWQSVRGGTFQFTNGSGTLPVSGDFVVYRI